MALAEQGADIAISYEHAADRAATVVAQIEALGRRAVAIQADAADAGMPSQLVAQAVKELGGLDVLVNNAGIFRPSALRTTTVTDIDALLHVNIRGVLLTTQAALPHLKSDGRIITIGSNLAERVPVPGMTLYAMTKSALLSFTRGLARELGADGITVNLVQPGPIDTDLNPADGPFAEMNRSMLAISRYGTTKEMGAVVAFLASPAASYLTGSIITADGGFNA